MTKERTVKNDERRRKKPKTLKVNQPHLVTSV